MTLILPRLSVSILLALMTASVGAAEDHSPPLTEWGQPDLQGVWNFSSDVPMLRPLEYGARQFLNQQEIDAKRGEPIQRLGSREPIRSANGAEAF